jgi:hypothetical protein
MLFHSDQSINAEVTADKTESLIKETNQCYERRTYKISKSRIRYLFSEHYCFEMSPDQVKAAENYEHLHPFGAIHFDSEAVFDSLTPVEPQPENPKITPKRSTISPEFNASFRKHVRYLAARHWLQTHRDCDGYDQVLCTFAFFSLPSEPTNDQGGRNSGRRRLKLRSKSGRSVAITVCCEVLRIGGRAIRNGLVMLLRQAAAATRTCNALLDDPQRRPRPRLPPPATATRPPVVRWRLTGAESASTELAATDSDADAGLGGAAPPGQPNPRRVDSERVRLRRGNGHWPALLALFS